MHFLRDIVKLRETHRLRYLHQKRRVTINEWSTSLDDDKEQPNNK